MKTCIVYGAGRTGKKVLETLSSSGIEVIAFIDEYSSQTSINGIPVFRLVSATMKSEYLELPVVISVFNPKADMRDIVRYLAAAGFKNIVDFYSFYQEHSNEIGDLYWLSSPEKMKNTEALTDVRQLMTDQKSVDLFDRIIEVRTTYSIDSLPEIEESPQYCPNDIQFPYSKIRFADCGAFTGDSINSVVSAYPTEAYYCFEPDGKNFTAMRIEIERLSPSSNTRFVMMPCGVWEKNEVLKFCSDSAAGNINDDGDIIIQCVSLDNVFYGESPNYIKMDVEGAELAALRGAKRIIEATKPILAICVYHKPEDLWEIPLYLHKLNPEYKFYLRQYEHNLFDTVLYAV